MPYIPRSVTGRPTAVSVTNPVGPSAPLRQVYPVLEGVIPPVIPTTRNTRDGRGMIVPVTVVANTPITVTHNLGRLVQGFVPLINDAGAAFTPKLMFGAGPHSNTQVTVVGDTDMTNCLIRFI
jgi:hypothetical protein